MEQYLIEHCSPTLAKIKTANLFTYLFSSEAALTKCLKSSNERLNHKGVYVEVLRTRGNSALIWVYRRSMLESDLQKPGVKEFLSGHGYEDYSLLAVIKRLKSRLAFHDSFPHEIGLFLGYPLADVIGFIVNEGQNSKCTGCWKVYCNECEAVRLFEMYKKCRVIYSRLFSDGKSILQLTVAA